MTRALVALCLAGLVALSACSPNGMPVDEYATTVESGAAGYADEISGLFERNVTELDTTVARLQDEFEGESLADAAVAETALLASMLFAGISDATDRYVAYLDDVDAPSVLETEHHDYIAALAASREGTASLLAALGDAMTFDDVDSAIGSSRFSDAQPRVDAACRALERAIRDQGPTVDLRCVRTS